ncbi:WYL domain-containing protein, partial [Mesorhizobium sp. M4A.F.Ca.ET.022.05.2.1]|uniref:WYL domain-containing protein n=1 Tax=Mesorhizobium sp. M4A.F.Ca.ET.022.05.2.1 TaxID=2496653 RepID=UPI000FCC12C7
AAGVQSRRMVWPFALGFFDKVRIVVAWCETRQDFRHFRADRISALSATEIRYPRRRQALLKAWRATLDAPKRGPEA